jgi:hypothetical protein
MIAGLRALRTYFTRLGAALPTANGSKHGQVNIKQASVTEDEAYLVLRDSSGVLQYRRLVTTTLGSTLYGAPLLVQEGGVTVDAAVDTLNFDASDFNVTEGAENYISLALAYGTSAGTPAEGNHTHSPQYLLTLGPFYEYNIPAATTAEMDGLFLSGATTVGSDASGYEFFPQVAGEIVGISIISSEARTAGSITPKVRLSGVNTDFAANACQINATTTTTTSWFVAPGGGVSFANTDKLGISLVSSATWAPTTAEHIAYLYARLAVVV